MSKTHQNAEENARIDSWKEIAAFFERDERTVKRWEKERALPIHRIPGERGGVFAYTGELVSWLNSTRVNKQLVEADVGSSTVAVSLPISIPTPIPQRRSTDLNSALQASAASSNSDSNKPAIQKHHALKASRAIWILASFLILCIVAFTAYHLHRSKDTSASAKGLTFAGKKHTPTPGAQELYLKGRYFWNHRTEGSLKGAVDAFTQAVVHDSDYAPAYAGLADSYNLMPEYSSMPRSEAFPRAIAAAQKAVALDDSLSEAHRALAFGLFYWEWDISGALREYKRAIELDPKDVEAHHWYATTLLTLNRLPEARVEIEKARELDPTSRAIVGNQAFINFWIGDRKASLAKMKELELTEPDFLSPPRYLARMLFHERDFPGFIAQAKRAAAISKDPQEVALAEAAEGGWKQGGETKMLEQMRLTQQKYFDDGQSSGYDLARTCALLGRKQEADLYFQAAFEAHDYMMMSLIGMEAITQMKGDPGFEQIRQQVIARMNQAPSSLP